jgi:ribosome-binding factor A
MQGKRVDRINSLIRSELGQIITTRLKDSRLGFATVTEVDTSPDLKACKVYISVIGSEKEQDGTLAALKHSEGFLKREISKSIKLRHIPNLYFKLDSRVEDSMRLQSAFNQIDQENRDKGDSEKDTLKPEEEKE